MSMPLIISTDGVGSTAPRIVAGATRSVSFVRIGWLALWLFLGAAPMLGQSSFRSKFTYHPPNIDGQIGWGEWDDAYQFKLDSGYMSLLNDLRRLYVLINVTGLTKEDPEDYLWLTFDVNRDRKITPEVDLNYALDPTKRTLSLQRYLGAGRLTPLIPVVRSSLGPGSIRLSPMVRRGWRDCV